MCWGIDCSRSGWSQARHDSGYVLRNWLLSVQLIPGTARLMICVEELTALDPADPRNGTTRDMCWGIDCSRSSWSQSRHDSGYMLRNWLLSVQLIPGTVRLGICVEEAAHCSLPVVFEVLSISSVELIGAAVVIYTAQCFYVDLWFVLWYEFHPFNSNILWSHQLLQSPAPQVQMWGIEFILKCSTKTVPSQTELGTDAAPMIYIYAPAVHACMGLCCLEASHSVEHRLSSQMRSLIVSSVLEIAVQLTEINYTSRPEDLLLFIAPLENSSQVFEYTRH